MRFEVSKRISPFRAGGSVICLSLLLSVLTSTSVSASSAGGSCKKAGSRSGTVSVPLVCEKVNGKLKWVLASGGKCQEAGMLSGTVAKPLVCQVTAGKLRWAAFAVGSGITSTTPSTVETTPWSTSAAITPGAFCKPSGSTGYSKSGLPYICSKNLSDVRNRWTAVKVPQDDELDVPPLERVTDDGLIDFRGSSDLWRDLAVGEMACAINIDGQTTCRGWDSYGNLGDGGPAKYVSNDEELANKMGKPISKKTGVVVQSEPYVSISASGNSACAVGQSGQVYCWGENSDGQLGDGSTRSSSIPIPIRSERRFDSVSIGISGACGLTVNGEVLCWGRSDLGLIGDAKSRGLSDFRIPQKIVANASFVSLSTGMDFACAISTTGDVWCWGASWGNGDPDSLSTSKPFVVRRNVGARLVDAERLGTCVLTSTEIDCWGTEQRLFSEIDFRRGILGLRAGCSWTADEVLCRTFVSNNQSNPPVTSIAYFKQAVKKVETTPWSVSTTTTTTTTTICALSETGAIKCWPNQGGDLRPDRQYFLFED